jgi:exodeoxyribonuclease V alpha subunit
MEQITGSVTRLVFHNPETTYTVLRLAPDRDVKLKVAPEPRPASTDGALEGTRAKGQGHNRPAARSNDTTAPGDTPPQQTTFIENDTLPKLITVVGDFASIEVGQQLWVQGDWMEHPAHGRQFRADRWKVQLPTTQFGMRAYLASGLVRGIGPALAAAIVEHFGERTFDIIEDDPRRLLEVPGIGASRVQVIRQVWAQQAAVRGLMAYLQEHGLPPTLALKLHRALGPAATQIAQANPYKLTDVHGVGFRTADRLAAQAGLPRQSAARLEAGLRFTLDEFSEQGNTYMPRPLLLQSAVDLLEVPAAPVAAALDDLTSRGDQLVVESQLDLPDGPVYSAVLYRAETETAARFAALAHSPASAIAGLRADLSDEKIHWAASMAGQTELSAEQRQAIRRAVECKLSIITGGPGTGKTICLRSLVALLELHGARCVLVSPTGRAAKRLAEATGHEAFTIHRLLKFSGESFALETVEADVVIVDEASMMDLVLARQLLAALRPSAHLVLVGDADQLPAVGPGAVLRDLLASGVAAVTTLTHIFRQARASLIVTNAHRLNLGLMPLTPQRDCDFYLFAAKNTMEAADLVVDIACRRIPEQFGRAMGLTDPLKHVQVLAPMYKGRAGIDRLNARLQAVLNPPDRTKAERALPRCIFRVGDKVMITRNDYDREVSNGEIGTVVEIDAADQVLRLDLDGRVVTYDWLETDDLVHAYAISIHKAQGSEYPAVVIPLLTEHAIMLYRQLLYTAITRARRLCVLVGSRRALELAIATHRGPNRYSALAQRLRQGA